MKTLLTEKKRAVSTAVLIILLLAILLSSTYYNIKGRFPKGLKANGHDIGSMTIEEAAKCLASQTDFPIVTIIDGNKEYDVVFGPEHMTFDYTKALSDYAGALSAFVTYPNAGIIEHLKGSNDNISLAADKNINKDALKKSLNSMDLISSSIGMDDEHIITIIPDDSLGYTLKNTKEAILDKEALVNALCDCALNNLGPVDISTYRTDIEKNSQDLETLKLWDAITSFSNNKLIYQNDDNTITFGKKELLGFLDTKNGIPYFNESEDGSSSKDNSEKSRDNSSSGGNLEENADESLSCLSIKEDAVDIFIDELSKATEQIDPTTFTLPSYAKGKAVKDGLYAVMINHKGEKQFLMDFLRACTGENKDYLAKLEELKDKPNSELTNMKVQKGDDGNFVINRTPSYFYRAALNYREELGDTYIEINLSDQHMYLYCDGELFLDTDIVSGTGGRTPGGRYKIYSKERNRYLTGPTWRAYVNYWMPFNGDIGIHDAGWRNAYGGSIYLTSGSHGCVNTPLENMSQIYERVKIGTPVVCYY